MVYDEKVPQEIIKNICMLTNHKVDVNGELKSKGVTSNLEEALRQFRHHSSVRIFWVDALCINQDATSTEKKVQIPKMGQIYANAKNVVVWLGPEADGSALAMNFIEEACDVRKIDNIVHDRAYKPQWRAFAALIRRKWFNRRFVRFPLLIMTTLEDPSSEYVVLEPAQKPQLQRYVFGALHLKLRQFYYANI